MTKNDGDITKEVGGRSSFHGYQLTYPTTNEPVYIQDAGALLMLSGVLVQGQGANILLVTPNGNHVEDLQVVHPTVEEWSEFLRRSDDPLIYEQDPTGTVKAVHRKLEYAISGAVQQRIWMRDDLRCMFCGKKMGDAQNGGVQLTIDHFVPLQLGGANDESNLISSCRRDQKLKGSRDPKEFCESESLDYNALVLYLQGRCSAAFISHLQK